jgi:hypothetical protein
MGRSAFADPAKQVESVAGTPVNDGRRSVVKGGLASASWHFGRSCPLRLRRKIWLRTRRTVRYLRF